MKIKIDLSLNKTDILIEEALRSLYELVKSLSNLLFFVHIDAGKVIELVINFSGYAIFKILS